jgi:hypothetical protein
VCTCEAAILLKASAIIRKRIALLSACWGERFPFFGSQVSSLQISDNFKV